MEFTALTGDVPRIPDDLTVAQFILDEDHELRPRRLKDAPWTVADKTGESRGLEEIQRYTRSLSVSLRDIYSIGRNDVVIIYSSNHVDYPVCICAIHRLLGIVAPCNPASTVPELVHYLKLSKATLIITHEDGMSTAQAAAREVGLPAHRIIVLENQDGLPSPANVTAHSKTIRELIKDGGMKPFREVKLSKSEGKTQVAFYCSSSGTTGLPKLVKISHYALIANVLQFATIHRVKGLGLKFRPGDICLGFLPFFHIYGIQFVLFVNFFCSTTVVVVPKFSFENMLKSVGKYKITSLPIVPPQAVLLCKDPIVKKYDLTSLRVLVCGAAPLADEIYDQMVQLMPHVFLVQGYGSTESVGIISATPINKKHGRFGGMLVPGIRAKVVKSDGALATYNEEGELHVRTPAVATGYVDNEKATAETFLPDSWLRTGDLVKFNEEQEIIIVDRIKEMIKVRGFQVAPAELEGCLLDHPYVRDACVVGAPHPTSGEVPVAFITLTEAGLRVPGPTIKTALNAHVASQKAYFKRIHQIQVVDLIPKTPSGKLLRRVLRDRAREIVSKL